MGKLLVFGVSQYASLVARYIESDSEFSFSGFVVDDEYYDMCDPSLGVVYRMSDVDLASCSVFLALGYRSMRSREVLYAKLLGLGGRFVNLVSSAAWVDSSVVMGVNNIIMPGAVVEPGVVLGDNNVIWSNATICHDSLVGNHNFFAANSTVGGRAVIASRSFFGFSSVVSHGVNVGDETLLGASGLLLSDNPGCGRYLGVPAAFKGGHEREGVCVL